MLSLQCCRVETKQEINPFLYRRISSSFRGHVSAGERGGSARLLQEKKQAQASGTHDHQPGCLRFRLQSAGGAVLHHFMVLKSNTCAGARSGRGRRPPDRDEQPVSDPLTCLPLPACATPGCLGRPCAVGTASKASCSASPLSSPPVSSRWNAA